jgi:NADH-quinone oxidoreductase subunit N
MLTQLPNLNLTSLYPILVVTATAVLVLLADLVVADKRALGYLALGGVIIAFVVTSSLWPGAAASFQAMAVSDGFALVLDMVFLITAALALLVAMDYLTSKDLQRGEYYALILFAVAGMMAMAISLLLMR